MNWNRRVLLVVIALCFACSCGTWNMVAGAQPLQPTPTLVPIFPTEEPEPTSVPEPTIPEATEVPLPTLAPNPNQPPPTIPPVINPNPPAPDEPIPTASTSAPILVTPVVRITPPVIPDSGSGISPVLRTATITIHTRICDNEGFDPYSSFDLSAMTAECPVTTGMFGFTMTRLDLAYSKVTFGGVVAFSVPALMAVKIESAAREDYDDPVAVCQAAGTSDVWGDRQVAWDTSPGQKVDCTWFFVRNGDDINLTLGKLQCPYFAPESLSSATVFCDSGTLGTFGEVTLSDTNPATSDLVRPAGSGGVSFMDLAPGTYTVTETGVTPGTAWSYWGHCFTVDPADGSPDPTFPLVKSTSLTITLTQVGDTVHCDSTNVLETSSVAAPATATVKVKTAVCDNQGWDPYIWRPNSLADYQAECTGPDPGFVFTLSQIGGTVQTKSTAGGEITFTVAGTEDHALLVQSLATGYAWPVVFCDDSRSPTVPPSPNPTDRAGFFPAAGTVITCTFFNVLQTTDINLVVLGFICPPAYDIDNPWGWGGMANPAEACSTPGLSGTVTLSDNDPATSDQSVSSDGPPAVFLDLAPGTYALNLKPEPTAASSFLFRCTAVYPQSAPPFTLTPIGKGPSVSLPLTQAGKTVFCNWYVVPKSTTGGGAVSFLLPLSGPVAASDRRRVVK